MMIWARRDGSERDATRRERVARSVTHCRSVVSCGGHESGRHILVATRDKDSGVVLGGADSLERRKKEVGQFDAGSERRGDGLTISIESAIRSREGRE